MNKQFKMVDGKRVSAGIEWTDFTWNPVGGCQHACRWQMPDGSIAECYAETTANGLRSDTFYPHGFEHHYWHPSRLEEPAKVKTPARIFLDSMSDIMGHWVPDEQIQNVLDICAASPHHTFQLLTKNAPRLLKFEFPSNIWVGVSVPPTHMLGRQLTFDQQKRMLLRQMEVLADVKASVRWMSIEPLSFDVSAIFLKHKGEIPFEWFVVGAASNGRKLYQPKPNWVENVLTIADTLAIPVFFKGNLEWYPWREEFPDD
jgi:protein gp37